MVAAGEGTIHSHVRLDEHEIPIIRLRQCLLVSIQTELHDRLALRLQEELMEEVRRTGARGVVLDISSVEVIDSYITRILQDIGKGVRFMGSLCFIVGLRPAVAMTLVEMGIELDSVRTALNLDQALDKLDQLYRLDRLEEDDERGGHDRHAEHGSDGGREKPENFGPPA